MADDNKPIITSSANTIVTIAASTYASISTSTSVTISNIGSFAATLPTSELVLIPLKKQ